jgi:hypothetical protein
LDDFLSKHGIENPLSSGVAGFIGRELIKGFLSAERVPGRATFSNPHRAPRPVVDRRANSLIAVQRK